MSFTVSTPEPKTMALGGVATGRRNANEDPTVTGSMKSSGLTSRDVASSATMGMKMEATTSKRSNELKSIE